MPKSSQTAPAAQPSTAIKEAGLGAAMFDVTPGVPCDYGT
jgi:hypothetical protein